MSERKMCGSCPFNPKSIMSRYGFDWGTCMDNEMFEEGKPMDGSIAHGCHEIDDCASTEDKDVQCIGHLLWLSGVRLVGPVKQDLGAWANGE